jgi:hemoglobin
MSPNIFAFSLVGVAPLLVVMTGCSSSSSPSNGSSPDSGTGPDAATTMTLYVRLGSHAGIRGALDKVVQAELGDPAIASFFFNQVQNPVPAGHPTVDQLTECLTDQLSNAAGGPETFPTTVTDGAGSFTCRDMATIHQPLHISGGTFDKFVMIAAGELQTLGVAAADIQTIGTVLNSTKSAITDPNLADAGEMAFASGSDGGESDAVATTLYARLGNHAGIRGALDQVVKAELGDPAIASFFFNQVQSPVPAGHPTVDQLTECLTDQLANAAGGAEMFPTTVTDDAGSFTCRDMAVIHQPLHISGGTFDKFVMIAAGELQTLGVAATDIQTIGTVLTSTKSAIVDPNLADAGEMAHDAGGQ